MKKLITVPSLFIEVFADNRDNRRGPTCKKSPGLRERWDEPADEWDIRRQLSIHLSIQRYRRVGGGRNNRDLISNLPSLYEWNRLNPNVSPTSEGGSTSLIIRDR